MQSITKNKTQRFHKVLKILFLSILAFNFSCSSESIMEELEENILVKQLFIYGGNITNGGSAQLTVGVLPNNANNKAVTWNVLDTSIAQVSETGLLTAISNGEVIVKAEAKDGSGVSAEKK